jgi:4-hydroxybenzoate polyprenyltransferase
MKIASLRKALRPHQWLKNVLILIPALAAHRLDRQTLQSLALAIVSFSLCASGGYVLNDLLDVKADQQHHRKRHRPFASGQLTTGTGMLLVAGSWIVGLGLAAMFLPPAFLVITLVYLAVSAIYSLRLKREPVLDVMVLASLYVIRIVAGGVAAGVPVSTWLLAFMMFVSLSLAFLKRFIEVSSQRSGGAGPVPGRGYQADDAVWLHSAGIASGYLSAVVLAIYANSSEVTRLYRHPERLVLVCPLLVYWATGLWLKAHRREMHDDPLVAVAFDPATYAVAAAAGVIVLTAI